MKAKKTTKAPSSHQVEHHKPMKVSVGVIIKDADQKILLGKRKGVIGEGTWGLPGGHIKHGESILDCAKREVFNEVNINVKDIELLEVVEMVETGVDFQLIELGYKCEKWEGILELKEHKYCSEWKFFSIDKLPKEIFEPHRKIVDKLVRKIVNKEEAINEELNLFDYVHPHFKIAVQTFVVNDKNQLLMGLRRDSVDGGNWAVPGGHVDVGDTLEECAKRELREETGLIANHAEQFGYVEQPINISNMHYFHFGYVVTSFEDKPLINGEPEDIDHWEWFDLNKIPYNIAGYQREIIIKFLKLKGIGFGKK